MLPIPPFVPVIQPDYPGGRETERVQKMYTGKYFPNAWNLELLCWVYINHCKSFFVKDPAQPDTYIFKSSFVFHWEIRAIQEERELPKKLSISFTQYPYR